MFNVSRAVGVTLTFALSACGTPTQTYKAPALDQSQLTEIKLINPGRLPVGMVVYRDSLTCSGPQLMEAPSVVKPDEPRIITVKKNEAFTVGAIYGSDFAIGVGTISRKECRMHFTFLPEAANYTFALFADDKECGYKEVPASRGTAIVPREYKIATQGDGPWCGPLSQSELNALTKKQP